MENNFEPRRVLQAGTLRMRAADTNKELSDVQNVHERIAVYFRPMTGLSQLVTCFMTVISHDSKQLTSVSLNGYRSSTRMRALTWV
jgi:hypothetical protein